MNNTFSEGSFSMIMLHGHIVGGGMILERSVHLSSWSGGGRSIGNEYTRFKQKRKKTVHLDLKLNCLKQILQRNV